MFGFENRNKATKDMLDEMKSYKTAAFLILGEQPDSQYFEM